MRRVLVALGGLALIGAGVFWALTAPVRAVTDAEIAALDADADHGETLFWAGGCASCHAARGATGEARLVLAGGQRLDTPFGTFAVPNISMDPGAGIGRWSGADFANAMLAGVSPGGQHYYPAFPYTSYVRMSAQDAADLWAFWQTLPADPTANAAHDLSFPFTFRRGIGLWKRLYLDDEWVTEAGDTRGRYLVEGPGHCGECHTPRDRFGGLETGAWLAGAANPTGQGRIPSLRPADLDWEAGDIAYYLQSGFTPEFDSAGGHMASVVANMAQLTDADRQAIGRYLTELAD